MKKHWFHIFGYLLGIIILWACIVIFQQPFLYMLLFLLIILVPLSIWLFSLAIPKLQARAYTDVSAVETGNTVTFYLECDNTSRFSLLNCNFIFTLQNLYKPNTTEQQLALPVLARKQNRVELPVETAACGLLSLEVTALCVSDYLHFVTTTIPLKLRVQVPVFPPTTTLTLPSTAPVADGMDEYTESDNKGNLSSDIKEIREYRPGDRLQRIHWKLSAKLDDLLVKEMAHTTVLSLVILPECVRDTIEDTATALRTVMQLLWQREERFEVCLYNHGTCEFSYFLITDENDITECMIHFFYLPLYEYADEAKNAYFASSQKSAAILHISGTTLKRLDMDAIIG